MSLASKQRHRLKTIGKVWSAWESVPITDKMRKEFPYLKNVHSIFRNSRLSAHMFSVTTPQGAFMQVDLKNHTNDEISWAELQRAKRELFSPDAVALEIYPAEAIEWKSEHNIRILYVCPTDYELVFGLHLATAFGGQA